MYHFAHTWVMLLDTWYVAVLHRATSSSSCIQVQAHQKARFPPSLYTASCMINGDWKQVSARATKWFTLCSQFSCGPITRNSIESTWPTWWNCVQSPVINDRVLEVTIKLQLSGEFIRVKLFSVFDTPHCHCVDYFRAEHIARRSMSIMLLQIKLERTRTCFMRLLIYCNKCAESSCQLEPQKNVVLLTLCNKNCWHLINVIHIFLDTFINNFSPFSCCILYAYAIIITWTFTSFMGRSAWMMNAICANNYDGRKEVDIQKKKKERNK